ncbi:hypothetical protein DFJ73DRAFT_967477 [Zopfochytrium polystomum]|nr:hypothetical protein DFJ73DRAFT_967477 [Zopfochytrium polystomum]
MCGPRYQFCILCGTALETALSDSQFHTAARALLLDARWTRPGQDESEGCLYPLRVSDPEDPLEAGEVPDFDPDAATDCWFAMAADPSPPTVDARASTFYNDEVEDGVAFGFPFHAGCAKWICCALAERGVSLKQLVAYLGETVADQDGSWKWMGDLEECCPDGASIQEIHNEFYTRALFGWHAYCFARPDTIWWQKDYGINPYHPDPRPLWNEVAAKTVLGADDDHFDIWSDGFTFRLRRGTYEGGIVIVPIPSVAVPTDGTTAQLPSTPSPPSGEFPHLASPKNLPTLVLSKILDWLTAPTRASKTRRRRRRRGTR